MKLAKLAECIRKLIAPDKATMKVIAEDTRKVAMTILQVGVIAYLIPGETVPIETAIRVVYVGATLWFTGIVITKVVHINQDKSEKENT